ncbi:MAG: amidohydrolase family protein [Bryobacteraceae bacterium]
MKALIDVHSHLGQYSIGSMSADGDRLCALYRQAGVTHAVSFSIEACYGGIDAGNRSTLAHAAEQDMLSVMVVAHPSHYEPSRAWIAQARSNPKIVGIKLHPALGNWDLLSRASLRLMEEAIAPAGLPVLSHIGNDSPNSTIDKYLELAGRFPSVRFIAAHLGVGITGLADTAIDAWSRTPRENVWFDMGTLRAFLTGSVEALLRVVGPDRILFGTDAPLYHPAPFVRMLEALEIDDLARQRIAWVNAVTVIPALRGRAGVPT